MKKIMTLAAFVAASASVSQAQDLVAGFDFTNVGPGFTSAAATYSDLAIDGPASNPFGTYTVVDGIGGFADDIDFENTSLSVGTTLDSANRVSGINDEFGAGGSVFHQNTDFVTDATTGGFELTINPGTLFTDFNLSFAAAIATSGTATLDLTYSVDGGSTIEALQSVLINSSLQSGSGQTFSLNGAAAEQATEIIYYGAFSNIDSGTGVYLDNIQVSGAAVPEPSSFAAIAGVVTLGFVALRRRK